LGAGLGRASGVTDVRSESEIDHVIERWELEGLRV
jgi:hypothetical protein